MKLQNHFEILNEGRTREFLRTASYLIQSIVNLSMAKSLFPNAPISFTTVKTLLIQDLLYQMNELQNKTN